MANRFIKGLSIAGKAIAYSFGFYEGAQRSHKDRSYIWQSAGDAKNEFTETSRVDMMAISRLMAANSGLYRGACSLLGRYATVGFPQSQSADRAWAEEAEQAFRNWSKIPEVTGRLSWLDVQKQWNYGMDRDGDIGHIFTDSDFPQLQLIEAHRINNPKDAGEDWVDGVRVNKQGRPVAFGIGERNSDKIQIVPAPAFDLVGEPSRVSGTRHECAWAAGLNHVRDIKDITGFLKTAVKMESSIALVKKLRGGIDNLAAVSDFVTEGTVADGSSGVKVLEKIYGGNIPRLDVDEEIQSLATDRPSQNVEKFLEFVIRDFASGNGLPFEFVWNPTALSGPSQRFVINIAQRRIAERQQLIQRHADRVWGWVVAKLAKRKDIGRMPVDWYKVRWQKPAEITIDVGREQAQDRADFQAGLIDPAEFYGKQGLDVDDVLASRRAWAVKVLESAGEPTDKIPLWMLYGATPNGNPMQPAQPTDGGKPPPQQPSPEPDDDEPEEKKQ